MARVAESQPKGTGSDSPSPPVYLLASLCKTPLPLPATKCTSLYLTSLHIALEHLLKKVDDCSLMYVLTTLYRWFYCRAKIFQDIERLIHPNDILDKVVYDLDIPK